jgi:hypothetical protein
MDNARLLYWLWVLGAQAVAKRELIGIRSFVVCRTILVGDMAVDSGRSVFSGGVDMLLVAIASIVAVVLGAAADLNDFLLCVVHVDVTVTGLAAAHDGSGLVDSVFPCNFGAVDLRGGLVRRRAVDKRLEAVCLGGRGGLREPRFFGGRCAIAVRSCHFWHTRSYGGRHAGRRPCLSSETVVVSAAWFAWAGLEVFAAVCRPGAAQR